MSEPTIELSDALAVQYGFAPASTEATAPVTTEAPKETPATEAKGVTTPTATEKPTESEAPKAADETPKEAVKPLYTPDEIKQLCKDAEATGKINLDTSRLDPNGIALMKSFQQGLDGTWGKAKREREEAAKERAEVERIRAEFEQAKRDAENKRIFEQEREELGEDIANANKREREMQERLERLEMENRQAKTQALAMQIREDYRNTSSKYFIPQDQNYEDTILAAIYGADLLHQGRGEYPRTIEESAANFADKFGFTNVDNLWKIIRSNPENEKAVRAYYENDYIQRKAKGPTVSPSSAANVPIQPKPAGANDQNKSIMDIVRETLNIPAGEEIILTNN
ncbi:MAG: hypothetical protein PHU49_14835 [Syntrophorhabdaceae bacterium]|nr:hypothetical protein [Syntrophorhabdaceae bacterium]